MSPICQSHQKWGLHFPSPQGASLGQPHSICRYRYCRTRSMRLRFRPLWIPAADGQLTLTWPQAVTSHLLFPCIHCLYLLGWWHVIWIPEVGEPFRKLQPRVSRYLCETSEQLESKYQLQVTIGFPSQMEEVKASLSPGEPMWPGPGRKQSPERPGLFQVRQEP